MHTRDKGAAGEQCALRWYEERGRTCVSTNYTIQGGEIDIIVEKATSRAYIEVKSIDSIDDVHGFVTERKLHRVRKTIQYHLMKFPTKKEIQLDVVFIKGGVVVEVYDHVSGF